MTLRSRVTCAWPVGSQAHHPLRERFDPQPLRERRDEHNPGVRDRPLIIESDPHGEFRGGSRLS